MPIRNLDKIFRPRQVAVIGASPKPASVGHTVLRNLIESGFRGPIYPVNPKYDTLEQLTAYPRIADTPQPPDLAVICTPAATVPGIIDECGSAGVGGVIVLSAGFREAGTEGLQLEQLLREAARPYEGMRIVGPNSLGILSSRAHLNASFAASMPPTGGMAFISQSGALCTSVLDWALSTNIGFSHYVSIGNMLDVNVGDLIDYFAMDVHTEAILLYVETITAAREFISAARAFARRKPIIAYKAGRFPETAQAVAAHTGMLAGVDAVYEAAFARAGILRVRQLNDLFDCAKLLSHSASKIPKGAHLAIITNAGGPGVMAADALIELGGQLARLSSSTIERLNKYLPAAWSRLNPVDVLGDATAARFAKATEIVLADSQVDAVLVILTPQAMTDPAGVAAAIIPAIQDSSKPVLAVGMGGTKVEPGVRQLHDAGVPTYSTIDQAVRAFIYLTAHARNRELLFETPRDVPVEFHLDRGRLRVVFDSILSEGHDVLSESTSKALLEAYEIPVSKPYVARTADDAVKLAQRIGYPVAMKIFSPQITHKTEVGGVRLDLPNIAAVKEAFEQIITRARQLRPHAQIEGVTVQKMAVAPIRLELLVEAKRDPTFGMVLQAGPGGMSAEWCADRALALPPLSERMARHMLQSLRLWPLINGERGRPAMNVDRLIHVLIRLSYLVADYPEIQELEINPLLLTPDAAIAVDARVALDHAAIIEPVRPYAHLAIRPYPEQYRKIARLKDGTRVLLRPIKPEDEPLWRQLLKECSPDSIWFRFRYVFQEATHEMVTRFCFIDYDREIAIVAEINDENGRKLIGVGRLVADPDHREAEYAVLIVDAYQNQGLGSILTDYCLEICQSWGIERIVVEATTDNRRMLQIFAKRQFELDYQTSPGIVLGRRRLNG